MAFTCVVLPALQIIKKSATASGILRRSRDTISIPFFSWIAWIMALKIFEFFVNLPAPERLRVANMVNCSNNQCVFNELILYEADRLAGGLFNIIFSLKVYLSKIVIFCHIPPITDA